MENIIFPINQGSSKGYKGNLILLKNNSCYCFSNTAVHELVLIFVQFQMVFIFSSLNSENL